MAGRASPEQLTLLLSSEIGNVLTAMRYNARWAVVPSYYEEDRNEPSKYDDAFRVLRAQIYTSTDWLQVDPLTYLTPFLSLLKASDVSGPITGTVAVALQRILASDLILPETVNAVAAMNTLVEDTTQGKFESTNNAQDEVVLLNIVQVLAQAVECKASVLLNDDTYYKAFQAAFMLGDPVTKPKEYGEIMGYYARQVCGTMVRTLFTRLRLMAQTAAAAAASAAAAEEQGGFHGQQRGLPMSAAAVNVTLPVEGASLGAPLASTGPSSPWAPASAQHHAHSHSHFTSQPSLEPHALPAIEDPPLAYAQSVGGAVLSGGGDTLHAGPSHHATVPCMHGAKAAMEILDFLIELIKKKDDTGGAGVAGGAGGNGVGGDQAEDSVVFALEMVHTALLAAGPALAAYDVLVAQVHVELLHAMCEAVVACPALPVISTVCQILACLYTCLGECSIGQLELVLVRVLLRLADGKGVRSLEQQEVALEGLLDLLRTPGFVHDVFVNCDCRLERSNLYEEMCSLLSRCAHPAAKGALSPLHLVALEGLTAVLAALAEEGRPSRLPTPGPQVDLPYFLDIWTPMVSGQHPDLSPLMAPRVAAPLPPGDHVRPAVSVPVPSTGVVSAADLVAAAERDDTRKVGVNGTSARPTGSSDSDGIADGDLDGGLDDPNAPDALLLQQLRSAVYEKHLKQKVALAVDQFNKDHKKGLQALQALRLIPLLEGSPAAVTALASAPPHEQHRVARSIVPEDELAVVMGRFLHSCPGLNKLAIGELLGEPDSFYLKVLDAYTASFDFTDLKFDAGIRMFLESFRLPGEAQKIDRIINCFGKHFYALNQGIFRSADAAYVLAYSVIMLNTDRHNPQVKKKMDLEGFRRNLRGVNDGADFPVDFLNEVFYSIVRTELRMTEATSMDVSEQRLVELHQLSRTPRGHMLPAGPARDLIDGPMFSLLWGPAISAMCAVVDSVRSPGVVEAALEGLSLAAGIAATHGVADVADTILASLAKIPMQLTHITPAHAAAPGPAGSQRPDVVFGRDPRMPAVTRTIATIAIRFGDSLTTGWSQLLELVVVLYRQGVLPDTFTRALEDGEGGLSVREGESTSLTVRRVAAARAAAAANTSLFRSWTAILGGGPSPGEVGDPYAGPGMPPLSEQDRQAADNGREGLAGCALEDVFLDAKFLKQESLVHLVRAVIAAAGPIPRPKATTALGVSCSLAYTAGGTPITGGLDVAELSLELLFGLLLRNRDRIAPLWPAVYEHLHAIFRHSKEVDPVLVQKGVMMVMRLCLRLLPYKHHISEPLIRGVQLVSLIDEQVASDLAPTIAQELLGLLQGAAQYLETQPVWVALTGMLKIIQYDPPSFPLCVEGLAWVVHEGLSAVNFPLILQALVDLLERASERATSNGGLALRGAGGVPQLPSVVQSPASSATHPSPGPAGTSGRLPSSHPGGDPSSPQQGPASQSGGGEGGSSPGGLPAGAGDPTIARLLGLLKKAEEWLEVWWASGVQDSPGGGTGEDPSVLMFQQEAWLHVMSALCRASRSPNLQVRLGALECLQRSVVAAEKFAVPPAVVQRVLLQLLLPMTADMCRLVAEGRGGAGSHTFPQADVSARELIRALAKIILLYAPVMGNTPSHAPGGEAVPPPGGSGGLPEGDLSVGTSWGPAWKALLDVLVTGMGQAAPRSEVLAEAIPEALKNMVLMLAAKGALQEGWRDGHDGSDLHDATWRAARKVSANLTPDILQLPKAPSGRAQ